VIKISEMRSGITAKSDRASMDIPPKYVVNDGDVLFSWSGSLAVVVWTGGRGALNQHLFKVTSQRFPPWFFVGWLQQHLPTFQEIAAGKATTMGHIQRHHLSDAKVAVPPPPVLQAAQRTMGPLFERGILNSLQTRTLAHTRDALLPRLLSGELRVSDVDKVEAA
jgi:type I restriction enzyme S subunit